MTGSPWPPSSRPDPRPVAAPGRRRAAQVGQGRLRPGRRGRAVHRARGRAHRPPSLHRRRRRRADPGLPGFAPFVRGGRPEGTPSDGWDVRQRHQRPTPCGATRRCSPTWRTASPRSGWPSAPAGVPVAALARALDGVYLDLAPVVLDAGAEFEPAARELLRLYEERGVAAGRRARQPRRRPARPRRPHGRRAGARRRRRRSSARLCRQRVPGAARADRGRAAVPRRRRLGRRGAGAARSPPASPTCGR